MIDRSACPGEEHGTSNAYRNHGCRCPDASRANTAYQKRRRAGVHRPLWVSSVGVVRRRQALAAIGYGLTDLAPHFGTSWRAVGNYLARSRVHRSTYQRWVEVYDQLSMTPGPNAKARAHARRQGWLPPLAWDDDQLDRPDGRPADMPRALTEAPDMDRVRAVLAGRERVSRSMRPADRAEVVRALHADGCTDPEIVARTGVCPRTVRHIRTRLCLPVNHPPARKRAG